MSLALAGLERKKAKHNLVLLCTNCQVCTCECICAYTCTYMQSEEFDVYVNYARTYEKAVSVLQDFMKNDEAVEYLKVIIYPCKLIRVTT